MPPKAVGGCRPVLNPKPPKAMPTNPGRPALRASFSCVGPSAHGEIVVLEEPSQPYAFVVGWRRDRRHSRSILRLSAFHDPQLAISKALSLSCGYVPLCHPMRNRVHDLKRSHVYRWEQSFCGNRAYASTEAAQTEVACVAALFGVAPIPVTLGPANLSSGSYFTPSKGIVVAKGMLDEATILHEMAHYLVWRMRVSERPHGPAFTAVLIALHAIRRKVSLEAVLEQATVAGIGVNRPLMEGLISFVALALHT